MFFIVSYPFCFLGLLSLRKSGFRNAFQKYESPIKYLLSQSQQVLRLTSRYAEKANHVSYDADGKDGALDHGNTYDPQIYQDGAEDPSQFSKAQERKLLAKIDFRLMPVLSILYLLAFLGGFSNAHTVYVY